PPKILTLPYTTLFRSNLAWTASTDNVAVAGYRVERCLGSGCSNFAQVATPATASYTDTGLTPANSYSYRVLATDAAGNLSAYSNMPKNTTPHVRHAST